MIKPYSRYDVLRFFPQYTHSYLWRMMICSSLVSFGIGVAVGLFIRGQR
jgi:hypothetical protein